MIPSIWNSRKGKTTRKKNRSVVTRGRELTAMRCEDNLGGMKEIFWNMIVVKSNQIVHLKQVKLIVYKLYLNKTSIKK